MMHGPINISGYSINQPVLGRFIVADHNSRPFRPIGFDQPGGEPLFRELVHKSANRLLDIRKVLFGDLTRRIILLDNGHPKALPSDPGITKLPNLFEPLSPPPGSAPGGLLSFAWA